MKIPLGHTSPEMAAQYIEACKTTAAKWADGAYLVESMEHTHGANRVWWAPNKMGYTCDIDKAGRYTLTEATEICADPTCEKMWKEEDVFEKAIRVVLT